MLVLSRKRDEVLVIETPDGLIEITVCSNHATPVRLGTTAPKHFRIHRKEVYEAIQRGGRNRNV